MPRIPGQSRSQTPPVRRIRHSSPDQGTRGRRILPSGPSGWAKLVFAIAALVTAVCGGFVAVVGSLTEAAKMVIGG